MCISKTRVIIQEKYVSCTVSVIVLGEMGCKFSTAAATLLKFLSLCILIYIAGFLLVTGLNSYTSLKGHDERSSLQAGHGESSSLQVRV